MHFLWGLLAFLALIVIKSKHKSPGKINGQFGVETYGDPDGLRAVGDLAWKRRNSCMRKIVVFGKLGHIAQMSFSHRLSWWNHLLSHKWSRWHVVNYLCNVGGPRWKRYGNFLPFMRICLSTLWGVRWELTERIQFTTGIYITAFRVCIKSDHQG